MSAWHGSQELKDRIVERMRKHREADDFMQGVYQEMDPDTALGYRGCAIGCALDLQPMRKVECEFDPDCDHEDTNEPALGWWGEIERQFGIPELLAERIDSVFERLQAPKHAEFAVAILEAIPVGANLADVEERWWNRRNECAYAVDEAALLIRLVSEAAVPEAVDVS